MKFRSGRPETLCGLGSTLGMTEYLRSRLPELLGRLGVLSLLDAPCGDCNWMAHMDLRGIRYVGVDNFPKHIEEAQRKAPHLKVMQRDILNDPLPNCDAILCRDFLQHLSNDDAVRAIAQFRRTGARWLLATSFDERENEDIAERGDFRRLNLEIPPVELGGPIYSIDDPPGSGRIIGAWLLW